MGLKQSVLIFRFLSRNRNDSLRDGVFPNCGMSFFIDNITTRFPRVSQMNNGCFHSTDFTDDDPISTYQLLNMYVWSRDWDDPLLTFYMWPRDLDI